MTVTVDAQKTGIFTPANALTQGVVDVACIGDSMTVQNNERVLINSASRSGGVVTVSATAHAMATGMLVTMANMVPSSFNVQNVAITVTDANTFTYQAPGADGSASNLSAAKPMVMLNMSRQQDKGYFFWLQSKSRGAFRQVVNAGANGQTSADMLSRFGTDVLASTAKLAVIFTGYNDFANESLSADTVYTNVASMATQAIAAGKRVVIVSALPWTTGGTTTNRGEAARYNRKIRSFCNVTAGARYADAAKYLVDATSATKFSPLSGMLISDGVHPTPKGAERIAQAIWDAIQYECPVVSRLVSSNADNYGYDSSNPNLLDEGPWTSSGGTVTASATGTAATGYVVSMSASGTCVASVVARSDGIGYDQQLVITPAAALNYGDVTSSSISSSRFAVGQKLQLLSELSLSNVSGSNLVGVNTYFTFNGPGVRGYACLSGANTANEFPQSDVTLTIVSPEIVIPSGTTSITVTHRAVFIAAGTACTMKVGRISAEIVG